jgi:hypothetical protein
MQKFIINISQQNFDLLEDQNLECFILSSNLADSFKAEFAKKAKEKQKLVLSFDVQTVTNLDLDGVVIDLSKSENITSDYKTLTQGLKKKFIGAICRNRRHEAMLVGECEPDFVIFRAWNDGKEKVQELTSWFNEMFLLQSALLPVEDVEFKDFETDFVILDDIKYKK